ncbi:hypothetical protein ON010_g9653 [Phytophthora cinnamomi]|nr:hypothetical protein ON010_g9653 [Phytophthora cinnamomi]
MTDVLIGALVASNVLLAYGNISNVLRAAPDAIPRDELGNKQISKPLALFQLIPIGILLVLGSLWICGPDAANYESYPVLFLFPVVVKDEVLAEIFSPLELFWELELRPVAFGADTSRSRSSSPPQLSSQALSLFIAKVDVAGVVVSLEEDAKPTPEWRDTLSLTDEDDDDNDVDNEDAAGEVNDEVVPRFTDNDEPKPELVRLGLSSPSKSSSSPQPSSAARSSAGNVLKLLCFDDDAVVELNALLWFALLEKEDVRDEEAAMEDPDAGSAEDGPPAPTSLFTLEATAEEAHAVSDEAYPLEL